MVFQTLHVSLNPGTIATSVIHKNTVVFVLGAGASMPYDYPSGEGLVNSIKTMDEGQIYEFVVESPQYTTDHVKQFVNDLYQAGINSIDRFLQRRVEYSNVGRTMIAYHLMEFEKPGTLHTPRKDRWYPYLYNEILLADSPDEFVQNRVSFITYNYDRSLETYFFQALKAGFGLTDQKAAEYVLRIPIIHVHGSFGQLPGMGPEVRRYASNFDGIQKAVSQLRIISDDIESSGILDECKMCLEVASHVVFLGFGYDNVNVSRLQLHNYCANAVIRGSALDKTNAEKSFIKNTQLTPHKLKIDFGENHEDCLLFLRSRRATFV